MEGHHQHALHQYLHRSDDLPRGGSTPKSASHNQDEGRLENPKLRPKATRLFRCMKIFASTNELTSFTILHLKGWLEALEVVLETDECPFETADELALQLDHWREEYQKNSGNHSIRNEPILILTYGNHIILIANQATGDYLKLETFPSHLWNTETSSSAES